MNRRDIKIYVTDLGDKPFNKWFNKLNTATATIVRKYIERVASGGSKKNIKSLQDGIFEIKINYGPGYRVYFAEEKKFILLLLVGGNKNSQQSDILKAKKYWRDYGKKK